MLFLLLLLWLAWLRAYWVSPVAGAGAHPTGVGPHGTHPDRSGTGGIGPIHASPGVGPAGGPRSTGGTGGGGIIGARGPVVVGRSKQDGQRS